MNSLIKIALVFSLIIAANAVFGQATVQYKISGENIYATIPLDEPELNLDSVLTSFGFIGLAGIETQKSAIGWHYHSKTRTRLILVFNKNTETKKLPNAYVITDADVVHIVPKPFAYYGVNNFKERSVVQTAAGTRFTLKGFEKAGSFEQGQHRFQVNHQF